jgi:hypothetical protein
MCKQEPTWCASGSTRATRTCPTLGSSRHTWDRRGGPVVGGITYERSHHAALSPNVAPAAWAPDGGLGASRRAGACRPSPPTTPQGPGEVDADMHPVVWVCLLLFDTEDAASASPFFCCFHGKPFFSMALSTRTWWQLAG